ncbi:GTP-binding protein TypA [Candidatus Wolfebacteria bacterium RIFCSPHIGHO2_01_FULL_48_22]|uniref:50S ribosomal subunit assembly factor BipA n=2 Tax=Candidatus Wolfeibacteriota TaxID=1752735 RepID=A0A1F8DNT7_9BACT|nr:MAG: GTP-binding protein TypA [Candidatus Wolfebacteria bacterium RIFCSPHIGHO2_01_FULL_48_22]OGM93464.1 MAG: GTP-binding protein TypA [Candidatus Wolfebacteria bacterium RIFCSPLOWO2_01_FULL_47_17b]
MKVRNDIRNIAIIAHVDHGKTTLVDALLKQSENFTLKTDDVKELIMDSNELERERGITIFSKNASIHYKGLKINIVDTPGHADFGGEVERIMRMVDGVLLLVDAKEGPMPQTKFVLRKAIQARHKIIVVVNKIDKPDARPLWALDKTFDLCVELGASEEQANFPVLYAAGTLGKAGLQPELAEMQNIEPLFHAIEKYIPGPTIHEHTPLQMLTVNLAYDNYKGKIAIGRLYAGTLKRNVKILHINRKGVSAPATVTSVMLFEGLKRVDVEEATEGELVAIAGIPDITIGETLTDIDRPLALDPIHIDEPTIKMMFGVNTSPFMGQDGKFTTSRNLRERLLKELDTDVALLVAETDSADTFVVSGRGELHLAILIEKMRREGYELEASKPQVIFKDVDGKRAEPIELVSFEVPEEFSGTVIELMGKRLGTMKDMRMDRGIAYFDFVIPTRGLIGVRNAFTTTTKGKGIMNSIFLGYEPYKGDLAPDSHGSIVASESGISNSYGLITGQGRGQLFIGPGVPVYKGMVVGQNAKAENIPVNICKTKELSNMRSKNQGIQETLDVPRTLTLEDALDYIGDDELVEVTPKNIRIRKMHLHKSDGRYQA